MTYLKKSATTLSAALILFASAIGAPQAMAASFSEEGARVWIARTEGFIQAAEAEDMQVSEKAACQGLFGELMQNSGKVANWASESHRSFCRAIDGFRGALTAKNPCKDLKASLGYLKNVKPGKDPEEVVAEVARFQNLIERMIAGLKEMKTCR